jgi:uncharacterized protein (TIGR03435 family)
MRCPIIRAIVAAGGLAAAVAAQQLAPEPAFEVATIKPSDPAARGRGFRRRPGGMLEAVNITLRNLITWAYNIQDHQLQGGPSWLDSDRYDVAARPESVAGAADPGPGMASTDLLKLRTQALLADRFKLTFHRETREMPIYALLVARNGPKLQRAAGEGPSIMGEPGGLTCQKVSMKLFAEMVLSRTMGRSVVDATGLDGEYDFKLKFSPDEQQPRTADPNTPPVAADPASTALVVAVQEQLGLKLESRRGPVEVLIIDRAEKPSEN